MAKKTKPTSKVLTATPNFPSQVFKIVIIEDDPDDVLLAKDYLDDLQSFSTEVRVCETYQEGWAEILRDWGDVYLIDQHLGAEKGVSLIARARDRGIQKPMILLTGNDSLAVDFEAQKAGATDYVFKGDLKPSILARSIRYSLAHWQAVQNREKFLQERIARREAEEVERRKSDFLKIASHELKTPIASTLASMYLLKDELEQQNYQKANEYADRMHRQLNHLTGMVEDLLDLSKIEMEQLGISPEIINLTQLISIVVQDLSSISRRKIDMKMPDEEVYIQADSARINQVLTNLVSNAIQHSGQDDKIIVALEPSDDFVEIKVTDQGEGISPENLQQVFNKFFSGKGAAGGQQIGLGLGLFLSKHIVDLHHGNITASSRLGKGSTFVIQLPFEQN